MTFRFEDQVMIPDSSNSSLQSEQDKKKTRRKKDKGVVEIAGLKAYTKVLENGSVEMMLPLKTISEANSTEAWQRKHRRHKSQKNIVFWTILEIKHLLKLPCLITLTRYAPRELDFYDNLPMSFKWILDSLSDMLIPGLKAGRADNDKRIKVKYNQVKNKKYFIKIELDFTDST